MWKRFQKVLPSHPGRNGGGLMSTGASQSPPRIVPESSESARDVIALHPARMRFPLMLTGRVRSGGATQLFVDTGTEFGVARRAGARSPTSDQ
jgi:hypothetical protein